ncbi:type III PLP-dependent enzyme [Thalassovita sp.]|uniref:type III PLP-dependent enzyme n=1 Tax=Thalassovita sp. TaxID=1979401 RepID=UPI002B277399|nr:type III PLP-dependent enzyme [Thalassovita sp.]
MRPDPHWLSPRRHLHRIQPDSAVMYFSPVTLQQQAHRFLDGFPGLVSYAVKANPDEAVLVNLVAAGITVFDVASPAEMAAVRAVCPDAVLHYNNPVRSPAEVAAAAEFGIASASVDCPRELDKLAVLGGDLEISVRLALPVKGAAYDFGAKFGVGPAQAVALLRQVAARGYRPALTFHPGTQCAAPEAWEAYITAAADVARRAGVVIDRLNVGGGFASHRAGAAPDLSRIFDRISQVACAVFDPVPQLVCEPGRAMVAEAFSLAARVKAMRSDGSVFLNDGIYGALSELRDMSGLDRLRCFAPDGEARSGRPVSRILFGPTCDSLDRLPDPFALPDDLQEGDYILFDGMGAYSMALATRFNGYGPTQSVTVASLDG